MNIITRPSHQAKSSKQYDADEVEINNMDADTRLPRRDKVMIHSQLCEEIHFQRMQEARSSNCVNAKPATMT